VVLAGKTALHVAARHGSVACIQLLVEAGAEVEPEEAVETSNLRGHHVFFRKSGDFGASSIKPNGFLKPFRAVSINGICGDLQVYTSPLHVAARHGRAEAARLLLDLGAEKDYSSNMQDRCCAEVFLFPFGWKNGDTQVAI
jgi:ankyrin repeat protein